MSWTRLIRFQDDTGATRFGEPLIEGAEDLEVLLKKGELYADELEGTGPFALGTSRGSKRPVKKILAILTPEDVPIVKCIGLNYIKHIQEGGRTPPPYPSVFIKARTTVASYDDDVPVPKIAQKDQCDYESELSIVIGKTGKNITKEQALDYVAGYVSSNDISSRTWQRDPAYAGGVPQWCFSKGFDKYAPLGPMMASPKLVGDAGHLRIQTFVNGDSRQDSNTSDMLFNVRDIISFISQGTTLERGTVIMTGTPSGVAFGMKPKPVWLKDGDVVEVKIEHLGSTRNRIAFE